MILVYTLVGVWLFINGFLLSRHELQGWNQCSTPALPHWSLPIPPQSSDDASLLNWAHTALHPVTGNGECILPPTHAKAVVLIIDALRYDFIAPPPPPLTNATRGAPVRSEWQPNPYYHNVLSLPAQLTETHAISASADSPGPASFLAHFTADPPTTTLQRLKGLTTGTLPTFVEAGANFGSAGTRVGQINEDNWIAQFKRSILSPDLGSDLGEPDLNSSAGLVFAGDDTWNTVLPHLFDSNTTWTYDSFNVEDLDTVDRGVESKLLPFLQTHHPDRVAGVHDSWRLLVGHTLGVDHVGHRFGASHPKMKLKLQEMQDLLRNITDAVDQETLVVVMGDHGMDERGDHGGDAELEVGAGIWVYSKRAFGYPGRNKQLQMHPAEYISTPQVEAVLPSRIPFSALPSPPYSSAGHRSIPQIDLVPTISILLGLPVPYNSLGSIIPDLFAHPDTLLRALRITSTQMRTYLNAYATKSPDFAAFQPEFDALWLNAVRADAQLARLVHASGDATTQAEVEEAMRSAAQAYHAFNRISLARAREVWAQFDMVGIVLGLIVLLGALAVAWVVRDGAINGLIGVLPAAATTEQDPASTVLTQVVRRTTTTQELHAVVWRSISRPALVGAAIGAVLHGSVLLPLPAVLVSIVKPLTLVDSILVGASIASQLWLLASHLARTLSRSSECQGGSCGPATSRLLDSAGWILLLMHAALFASNSLLVFEDRFVLLALASLLLVRGVLLVGASPTTHLRLRSGLLTLLALVLVRLAAVPRVCREEQAANCESTFFASTSTTGAALNSPYTIALAYALAYALPSVVATFLKQSKSFVGIAPRMFTWVWRPTLMIGAGHWALDYAVPLDAIQRSGWANRLEWIKHWMVKLDFVVLALALVFWIFAPLCLEIRTQTVRAQQEANEAEKQKVTILGYANSLGSSFLLLVGVAVSLVWVVTQPSGQVALAVGWVAASVCVELTDAERDVVILFRQRIAAEQAAAHRQDQPESSVAATVKAPHLTSGALMSLLHLCYLLFFSTGHQSTLASIQWRVAFVSSPTLTYPSSPLLVMLNSFGALTVLPCLLTVLAVLWNTTPLPRGSGRRMPLPQHLLSALTTLAIFNTFLLLTSAALSALLFRRHLMLFKVWTPRVLLAVVASVGGQLAGLVSATAAWHLANKVNAIFGSEFA